MRFLCLCGLLLVVIAGGFQSSLGQSDNCQSVNESLGDLCTVCMVDTGGIYFRCDVEHTYKYCESTPGRGFACAFIQNNCTGTRTNYATEADCLMMLNPVETMECGSKYGYATLNIAQSCP